MYLAFKHSHLLTAVLSLLLTLVWTAVAWNARPAAAGQLNGTPRWIYIAHRVIAGLAGITGLAVTFAGPWRSMVFPYIGLAAFIVHGIAATVSKRTFADAQKTAMRRIALLIQIAALLLSAYIMAAKPF